MMCSVLSCLVVWVQFLRRSLTLFMRIQDGELAGIQQNVSKFVFGDYCSFVTYLIGNLGLVQYSGECPRLRSYM